MKPHLSEVEITAELQDFPDDSDGSGIEEEDNADNLRSYCGLDIDKEENIFDAVFKAAICSQENSLEVIDDSPQPSTSTDQNLNSHTSQKEEVDTRKWRKNDRATERPDYAEPIGITENMFAGCDTPTDIFLSLIGNVVDHVLYQSNLYGTQNNKNLNLKKEELLIFIGINFLMGYHKLPSWKDYWSTNPDLHLQPVAEAMSRDRFAMILSYLHVNDNQAVPADNKDRLYKVRPLISMLNEKFEQAYHGTREVSVDECMIRFKGRSSIKQYNPMKPIKRGYKLWCAADQHGYILSFKVYQGKDEQVEAEYEGYGLGERVVLDLTKNLWGKHREVYFDNYFSSPRLLERLAAEKTLACGTVRANRKGLPNNMTTGKKMERGESDHRISNTGLSFYLWKDTKPVHVISNFHGSEKTTVKRKERDGSSKEIPCTVSISDYNKYMGGVDFADRLRALYGIDRRSKKWWHRLFWGLFEIAFVNAYVIFKDLHNQIISVLEFRRSVVLGLLTYKQSKCKKRSIVDDDATAGPSKGVKRRKSAYSVPKDVRTTNRGIHWPTFNEKRGRCEVCSKKQIESRPHSKCTHCKVFLCVNDKKNCFAEFHELDV